MWIVRVALDRPYTFIVLALLILLLSPVVILRTPTDIFPVINIPVIAVAWQYTGLNPQELEGRITTAYERVLTTTQLDTMRTSYLGLLAGLAFAIVLIYLLIVVNFQSWLDPFIIISALPAALAGIVVFLFLTRTTLSVPALMGAIMCMGVGTANSILVVAFARERLDHHGDAAEAAIEAGATRFRPVLMTALAMIIGMIPMALGLGEGGEQNAPLGRAVIGGLLCATIATLVFVPAVFGLLHGRRRPGPSAEAPTQPEPGP